MWFVTDPKLYKIICVIKSKDGFLDILIGTNIYGFNNVSLSFKIVKIYNYFGFYLGYFADHFNYYYNLTHKYIPVRFVGILWDIHKKNCSARVECSRMRTGSRNILYRCHRATINTIYIINFTFILD